MEYTWRWFGPDDPVRLHEIKQTGATGIVTALNHIPPGKVWDVNEIMKRKNTIEKEGLKWSVVESVPVHGDIKKQTGDYQLYIDNYKQTIKNLGECGIRTLCYNFIPMLDWIRTDHNWKFPDGSITARFDMKSFAAFDLFILQRAGAAQTYPQAILEKAEQYYNQLDEEGIQNLTNAILLRLPGTEEKYGLEDIHSMLKSYSHLDRDSMKEHLFNFIRETVPIAEEAGVKMAIHADDPPFSLFGIPRVVSTKQDALDIIQTIDSESNGVALCTGSFGAGHFNNLVDMTKSLAHRINFIHLRNLTRDEEGNFCEVSHLGGDIDLYHVIKELVLEEQRRKHAGKIDWQIPMRPDHGQRMLYDINKTFYPGYSFIGRMKALAELRGLVLGIQKCYSINEV